MVHSNIQSSGVNLKKAVKGAGRAQTPVHGPLYPFDSLQGTKGCAF